MPDAERRAALRGPKPAGTRIYAVPTTKIQTGPSAFTVVPTSSIVSNDGRAIAFRQADGTVKRLEGGRVVEVGTSMEVDVEPGQRVPAYLRNVAPEVVIR